MNELETAQDNAFDLADKLRRLDELERYVNRLESVIDVLKESGRVWGLRSFTVYETNNAEAIKTINEVKAELAKRPIVGEG